MRREAMQLVRQAVGGKRPVDGRGNCGDVARFVLLASRSFHFSVSTFPRRNTPPETYLSSSQLHRP